MKERIRQTWNDFDDEISTERLLQMTADACGCDVTDVVDALAEKG